MLSDSEQKMLNEIKNWENSLYHYEPNDFVLVYEKYLEQALSLLPEQKQEEFFSMLDTWLFHLHALIQGSEFQHQAKERILFAGRVFQEDISQISDLKGLSIDQLQYIAQQQITRHRFYSFTQGGLSGTGGPIILGADIPAIAVINLRVVQLIALAYGNEVNNPFEMMTSLKVFHAATLPTRMQGHGWEQLMNELHDTDEYYFYNGEEKLTDSIWVEQPLKQILKAVAILLFKKKRIQGIPFVSMALGAGMNYGLTRKVTDFAHKYYQMRFLLEKEQRL